VLDRRLVDLEELKGLQVNTHMGCGLSRNKVQKTRVRFLSGRDLQPCVPTNAGLRSPATRETSVFFRHIITRTEDFVPSAPKLYFGPHTKLRT